MVTVFANFTKSLSRETLHENVRLETIHGYFQTLKQLHDDDMERLLKSLSDSSCYTFFEPCIFLANKVGECGNVLHYF